jgi:SAM-dependent methyltransferase
MDQSLYHVLYEVEDRHWWFVGRRAIVDGFLARVFGRAPADRRILDVGCGTGGMLPLLSRYGRVTGVDAEPLALDYCRKRGIEDVHLQDGFQVAESYDVITLFDVLEHVEDEAGFLNVMMGWLKPGGRIILTVPAYEFLWSRHDDLNRHQRRYTRKRLVRALSAAGFTVGRTSYFNTLLFPLAMIVRLLDNRKPIEAGRDEEEILKPLKINRLNGVLTAIFSMERHLLKIAALPFGVSLYAEAQRDGRGGME